jgi:DNA-binding NtrC family response regulator
MPHRILMMSDEQAVAPIEQFFTRRGHRVDSTSELAVAEALLCCTEYSLVFLDMRAAHAFEDERLDLVSFAHAQSAVTRVVLVIDSVRVHEARLPESCGFDALLQEPVAPSALFAIETLFLRTAS